MSVPGLLPPETEFRRWICIYPRPFAFLRHRNDPTPDRGQQLPRAASLIVSSLGFIHDLRAGMLEPDNMRGTPLDMDQYTRLFGTARIPTEVRFFRIPHPHTPATLIKCHDAQRGCKMEAHGDSRHIVVLRRGQFCEFAVPSPMTSMVTECRMSHSDCPDWFDVLDSENRPVLTEREILRNLQAIVSDADQMPIHEVRPYLFELYSAIPRIQ